MNLKRAVPRLMFISMLLTVLIAAAYSKRGAHVDEHLWKVIIPDEDYLNALLTHDRCGWRTLP